MSAQPALRTEHASSTTSQGFDRLLALVDADMRATNQLIVDRMASRVPLIPQLAGYLIAAGGKRLRPLLTLASAQLCDYRGVRHHGLAACVEFIHTATLLHDDVVDESDLRRGQRSANAVFGNQASVLVGDFLFSRAFELMTADGSLAILKILSSASKTIAEGEVMQLSVASNTDTTEADYLEVITGKTAALFAAACEVGAVVAERSVDEQEALRLYGLNLGIAFQLVDDVLDYSAIQAKLGKEVGNDFREGKMTLPVLLAFKRGSAEEKAFWQRTVADKTFNESDLAHAITLMQKHGALAATIERARQYGAAAQAALSVFPPSPIREAMLESVSFVIERDY
jgi:octaprenyl-diphosphate synthase